MSYGQTLAKKQPTASESSALAVNQADTANYIAELLLELHNLAKGARLKSLSGLLEVSYYEAFSAAHPATVPEGEHQFLKELAKRAAG